MCGSGNSMKWLNNAGMRRVKTTPVDTVGTEEYVQLNKIVKAVGNERHTQEE